GQTGNRIPGRASLAPVAASRWSRLESSLASFIAWVIEAVLTGAGLRGVACGLRVAQPRAGAEAEDGGQVQRVGPAGQGFFDDTVVADLFGGDGQAAEQPGHPELADGLPGVGGLAGDQQVRAGGGGPALVAEGEVAADRGGGELIERPVEPARVEPPAG